MSSSIIIFDIYNIKKDYGYIIENDGLISKYYLVNNIKFDSSTALKLKQSISLYTIQKDLLDGLYIIFNNLKLVNTSLIDDNEEEEEDKENLIIYDAYIKNKKVNIIKNNNTIDFIKLINILIEENKENLKCLNCNKSRANIIEIQSINIFCNKKCQTDFLLNKNKSNINIKEENNIMIIRPVLNGKKKHKL